jgi:hypothetical protein
MLYVFARKCKGGAVEILRPSSEPMKPAEHWLFIDKYSSHKPDYRYKKIILNCYKYSIFWVKEATQ